MHRFVVKALAGAVVVVAGLPATASADMVIEAQTVWRFDALSYSIDQGEPLTFRNSDALSPGPHNVTSEDTGADGRPVFASATVGNGEETPVDGARALTTGSYPFICTVHPFMQATLMVTDKGTPVGGESSPPPSPPPSPSPSPAPSPSASDTKPPSVRASLRRSSLRTKRFIARLTVSEPADLTFRLTARSGRRTIRVGKGSARALAAGERLTVVVRASRTASRRLRKVRRATFTLAVEARDAAGNLGTAKARRTMRR